MADPNARKDDFAAQAGAGRESLVGEFTAFLKEHEEFTTRIMTALNMVKK